LVAALASNSIVPKVDSVWFFGGAFARSASKIFFIFLDPFRFWV